LLSTHISIDTSKRQLHRSQVPSVYNFEEQRALGAWSRKPPQLTGKEMYATTPILTLWANKPDVRLMHYDPRTKNSIPLTQITTLFREVQAGVREWPENFPLIKVDIPDRSG